MCLNRYIWVLCPLFSCKKGGGHACFSYAFVSICNQSCIYNPTGKVGFRHNSPSAARVCCKIDQLAKWCVCVCVFKLKFCFLSGKKTKKSWNQQQQVLPKWYFSYLCWFQGRAKECVIGSLSGCWDGACLCGIIHLFDLGKKRSRNKLKMHFLKGSKNIIHKCSLPPIFANCV